MQGRVADQLKNQRFQLLVENARDYAIILFNPDNRVVEWNSGAERMLGYTAEEVLGQSGALFFLPEDRAAHQPENELATAKQAGRAEDERWHLRKDGSRFRASGVMSAAYDEGGTLVGFVKILRDVTERERARDQLEQTLRERDILLREVHHRVKNNLQVIVSLLRIQASHLTDSHVVAALEESQNRVLAIARIHETLYTTIDLATIHFGPYLNELLAHLVAFYGARDRIVPKLMTDDMALELEQAVPVGLITNELVCNALKHGFPHHGRGHLEVGLRYLSPEEAELRVSDDGVGLPADFDVEKVTSMGYHLVTVLARQLRGKLTILRPEHGTEVLISFPLTPLQ